MFHLYHLHHKSGIKIGLDRNKKNYSYIMRKLKHWDIFSPVIVSFLLNVTMLFYNLLILKKNFF